MAQPGAEYADGDAVHTSFFSNPSHFAYLTLQGWPKQSITNLSQDKRAERTLGYNFELQLSV